MQPDELARCHCRTRPGGQLMLEVLCRAGIPPEQAFALECHDVHEMALLIARSRKWAKGERTLIAELPDRPLPTPSWLSMHRGLVIYAAYIVAWLILLFVVWRIA